MKDTFICGDCQQAFYSLPHFVQHKNGECIPNVVSSAEDVCPEAGDYDEQLQIEPKQENDEATFTLEDDDGKTLTLGPESVLIQSDLGEAPSMGLIDGSHVIQIIQADSGEQIEAFIETAHSQPTQELHLVPVSDSTQTLTDGTPVASDYRILVKTAKPTTSAAKPASGRRRGRPRKGEEKNPPKSKPPPEKKDNRPKLPPKGADGKFACSRCKKSFLRERHFVTHVCLAVGDYVDLSRKNALGSDDDESDEDIAEDNDKTVEFSQSRLNPRQRGRPQGSRNKPKQDIVKMAMEATIEAPGNENTNGNNQSKPREDTEANGKEPAEMTSVNNTLVVDSELPPIATHRDQIPDVPIFAKEEERLAFERSLDNVDLSMVDDMFHVHVIAQDMNENAPPLASRMNSELHIFSCKCCEKVFKTPSHMRLHCLTHTDLRPFACHQCDYSSNSKGNLYTHMRRHTRQLYRCSRCDFYSVNKSHLVEHLETHSGLKHKCNLCHKDYSSIKSLINHIRRYHHTSKGKAYLAAFQGRANKNFLLHQCHICNRKFKKETDRDRHLYSHNIRSQDLFPCDMCDYAGAHKEQLEKHYPRHRVVYICSECELRFPSTIRLNRHLSTDHGCSDMDEKWVEMFQRCISLSKFLPEPGLSMLQKTDDGGEEEQGNVEVVQVIPAADVNLQIACHDGQTDGQTEEGVAEEQARDEVPDNYIIINPGVDDTEEDIITEETTVENMTDTMTLMDTEEVMEDMSALQVSLPDAEEPAEDAVEDAVEDAETNEAHDAVATIEEPEEEPEGQHITEEEQEPLPLDYDILQQLKYVAMNMEVFHKLRQTYGNEECEYCGRLFYSLVDYDPHIRTHTGSKPFPCTQCGYRSNTKDNLKRHIEKEHENVTYVCNSCEFVASSRTQLWHHQQKHKQPVELTCPKCKVKVKGAKFLRIHIGIKHPELSLDDVKHILTGSKPQGKLGRRSFKCPYCPKTFLRASSDLQKHIWIHEGIKPFKCPHCPHACRSKNNLSAHLLKHSSVKPFQCTVGGCGKLYKSRTALRWHERVHKDGRIFKCHVCPYEAIQRSHLKRHMETHNVVKRFVCHHCDYSCNTLGFMKIHYTRNHKDIEYTYNPAVTKPSSSDARVYRCLSCDYLFGNLSDMKRHLKVRHHLQVEEICMLDESQGGQMTQILTSDVDPAGPMELQVVKVQGQVDATADERAATAALQTLQYAAVPSGTNPDEQVAVSLLQQIIDISQQGTLTNPQQITVMDGGQKLSLNQNTIIVSQDCEEVVVADGAEQQNPMFVIQYVNPDGTPAEMQPETGLTPSRGATSLLANATITSAGQILAQNSDGSFSADGQIINQDSYQIVQTDNDSSEMVNESELAVTSSELEPGMLLPPGEEVNGQSIMQLPDRQYVQLDESGMYKCVQTTDIEGADPQGPEDDDTTQLIEIDTEVNDGETIKTETIDIL